MKAIGRLLLVGIALVAVDGCGILGIKKNQCYTCTTEVFNSGVSTSKKETQICDQSQMEAYRKANQYSSGNTLVTTTCINK